MQMMFSSIYGSYLNHSKGAFKVKEGLYVGLGGLIGAQASGPIITYFSSTTLTYALLCVVLFAIYRFFKAPLIPEKEPITSPTLLFILGLFTGVAAISVGIGGSLILTPVLSAFFRFELNKSV
jgi:uncharacterized membrane protein YfcA